jgi:hypothetical protein
MADGSRTSKLEAEANAAAAEAAREARGEVMERAAPVAAPGKAAAPARARGRWRREWAEFSVDVWITNLNSVEFGFYKRSRNRAKSRQFTSDMDIYAEIVEQGERTGLIGYREELWTKRSGMDKRLVLKLFGEALNWRATMDMMLAKSLQLTLGAHGLPVTAYALNIGDHDQVVQLERSAHKWPGLPESFSFFLMNEGKPAFYRLRQHFIDIGGDYTLYDQANRRIGDIDGRVLSIGGYWRCRVLAEHADPRLMMVLKLFCGMLIFRRGARRHVGRLAADVAAGRIQPGLEKQEADLYMNPRRVR